MRGEEEEDWNQKFSHVIFILLYLYCVCGDAEASRNLKKISHFLFKKNSSVVDKKK
jgi:hypothetical protein